MKTIKVVSVVPEYVDIIPFPEVMRDGVIYVSPQYEVASHLCLCGCGSEVVTPLGIGGWVLSGDREVISLSPSVGNYNLPCKSHYIITKNKANFV